MNLKSKKSKVAHFFDENIDIEIRLTEISIILETIWSIIGIFYGYMIKLPRSTFAFFVVLVVALPIFLLMIHRFEKNKQFIISHVYFILLLLVIPVLWFLCGGVKSTCGVFFVYELVAFSFCVKGKSRYGYLTLGFISSGMINALAGRFGFINGIGLSDAQHSMLSAYLGSSTSIMIILILYFTKYEYDMEKALVLKKDADLERSNKQQKIFLANMSHEIRTPLSIVLGFNDLILDANSLEEAKAHAGNVKDAGKMLSVIINDVIDYSRIEAGKLDILPVDFSINKMIENMQNEIKLKCSEKGLDFILNHESFPYALYGDDVRIKQCLINVLNNAVKYTDKGSVSLTIACDKKADICDLSFVVRDTGQGMDAESVKNLFVPFKRVNETHNRGVEGAGLGLSITKNLLEQMGGSITVESKEGIGSTFVISLTLPVVGDIVEEAKEATKSYDIVGLKILAVDDVKMNLDLIYKILTKSGALVTNANSGEECIEICKNEKFDVILMDHMMPGLNGEDTFIELKKQKLIDEATKVIMLTANAMAESEQEYLAMGFDGYLCKPVKVNKLKEVLSKFV